MGVRNYLIEGVSGAGKTAVANELQRRGYHAVHGDRDLAYRGDPETGLPVIPPTDKPSAVWRSEHHLWDVEKIRAHVADRTRPLTFFCGASRNHSKFVHLLNGVFVLDVDFNTMISRIDERVARDPTDFGAQPDERELIVRLYAIQNHIPQTGFHIDATAPIAEVVDEILSKCAVAD